MGDVIKYLIIVALIAFLFIALIHEHYQKEKESQDKKKKERMIGDAARRNSEIFSSVESLIQSNMNDDNSYVYLSHEATYDEKKECCIMEIYFRGSNVYGGKVLNAVKAEISLDGQKIQISEQPDWTGWDEATTTLSRKIEKIPQSLPK